MKSYSYINKVTLGIIGLSLFVLAGCNQPVEETTESHSHEAQEAEVLEVDENSHDVDQNTHEHEAMTDSEKSEPNEQDFVAIDDTFSVANGRAKASIPGQKVSAAFFVLHNNSDEDVTFTSISADRAGTTEFHTMTIADSDMQMRHLPEVTVPANDSLILSDGGDHVMLMQLDAPLETGESVELTLTTQTGQTLTFSVPVE